MKVTLDADGILCTEAMLKHDRFFLLPDVSYDCWTLYSEAKYLMLEQKLFQQMVNDPALDPNSRLSRILLGNAIELVREGAVLPLDEKLRNRLGIKQIQLSME